VVAAVAAVGLGLVFSGASGEEPKLPDRCLMGSLSRLYPPVEFDHAVHVAIAGDCAICHHRPFGQPAACADCHSEEVEPSAFVHELHWEVEACTGCHRREGTDDLRCSACHPIEPDPERLEIIGLKGAVHGLCLPCHTEEDPGASCVVCHPTR
jgi:hypothetical protein